MSAPRSPRQVLVDPTSDVFATDSSGTFSFPLLLDGQARLPTEGFDEARFVVSLWHPSNGRRIDLDQAYVELRGSFDQEEEHWVKLAEIEPVVPAYNPGATFDGWLILPIFAASTAFGLAGSGFAPRARLQIRASIYLVN